MSTDPAPSPLAPRARLLAAAEELFYGAGIRATGVEAVLARAEVARNTLYHHFGGKDGLVAAYLEAREARWREVWSAAIAAASTPIDAVLAIFDALGRWGEAGHLGRGCAFLDAEVELGDPQHPATAVIADHHRHLAVRLTALAGATGLHPPEVVAADVLVIYRGTLVELLRTPGDDAIVRGRRLAAATLTSLAQPR